MQILALNGLSENLSERPVATVGGGALTALALFADPGVEGGSFWDSIPVNVVWRGLAADFGIDAMLTEQAHTITLRPLRALALGATITLLRRVL